jgi:hypothetical protein
MNGVEGVHVERRIQISDQVSQYGSYSILRILLLDIADESTLSGVVSPEPHSDFDREPIYNVAHGVQFVSVQQYNILLRHIPRTLVVNPVNFWSVSKLLMRAESRGQTYSTL